MAASLNPGRRIELTCDGVAFGGAGIARHEGLVVMVPRAAPGDRLRARVVSCKSGHAVAEIEELLDPSPDRVSPLCRHYAECGGCAYQHLPAERQSSLKARQVEEALERIGRIAAPPLHAPLAAPHPYGYRTRVELTVLRDARGRARLGFHLRTGLGEAFVVEECAIAAPALEELRARLDALLSRSRIAPFDTRSRKGFLRRVVLRSSTTGETLVEFRTATPDPRPLQELVASLSGHPRLRGIVQVLDRGGRPAGAAPRLLWGEGHLRERVLGLDLDFPAGAFAQTHAALAPALYEEALRGLGAVAGEACLDLFCGVGAMSLLMVRAGARAALGVEVDGAAAQAASQNARRASLAACRFIQGDVEQVLADLPAPASGGSYSRAVLNPPRQGLSAEALRHLLRAAPRRITYISCDPATLARDLRRFLEKSYRLEWVRPVDLFPQTSHIESVAALALS